MRVVHTHCMTMNISDNINSMHFGDHPELYTGAEIFLQEMMEGKVQLAHFILVVLGHDAVNTCVESEGSTGRTLLMCAAELTHCRARACVMQLLLWRGADVERRDEAGRTALSLASQHGYLDAVRFLVLNGAQTDTLDNEGKRPLDYAAQEHHGDVVQFLLGQEKQKHLEAKLSDSVEELAGWRAKNCSKIGYCGFPRGIRRLLRKQSVSNLFLTEHVICNPYALEHDEETPKMVLNGINHASESQINLLVPDKDGFDNAQIPSSSAEEFAFTDNVVRNHWFLEEGSGNFFGSGRIEMHDISLSSKRKMSRQVHAPK